ncbi:hypothetical protein RR46_02062 [Papilio xuthus]|uniref:Uncharacterized protein n=1 Tax=Papilio xuthus TaxID=66420 RepID=A0A194QPM1_PAPXU|nr:hypothetical protein RR46_02062 [Papilio xuthus]
MKWSIVVLVALVAICTADDVPPSVTFAGPAAHVSAPVKMTTCSRPEECSTACEMQCPAANVANCINGQCNCGI